MTEAILLLSAGTDTSIIRIALIIIIYNIRLALIIMISDLHTQDNIIRLAPIIIILGFAKTYIY